METLNGLQVSERNYIFFASLSLMENKVNSRWQKFRLFLRRRYRLVILNDSTFAESLSLKLFPWQFIILILAVTIVMTTAVISLVAFTPLREYIPGYGNVSDRKAILNLTLRTDSLEQLISERDLYVETVLRAMKEQVETKTPRPTRDTTAKHKLPATPGKNEAEFREEYEKGRDDQSYAVARLKYKGLTDFVFFPPVSGAISAIFDLRGGHRGVDIVTKSDETIKSTLDGTVIYAGFSSAEGNVISIQHSNNLVSVYKHCAKVLKTSGERVKSGEVIAVVGNTGEKSTGPHLHFEMWFNGSAINPREFIAF